MFGRYVFFHLYFSFPYFCFQSWKSYGEIRQKEKDKSQTFVEKRFG